jgi:hypothetical protein
MQAQYDVPILLLIFNRLNTLSLVFEKIKETKPVNFYIACDGARANRPEEKTRVQEVRKYVLDNIDWSCNVHTLFRENNLGCGRAVSSAIDWFFQHEEMGIILEDDCLPNESFFSFCKENLLKYRYNDQIYHINGSSLYLRPYAHNESYFISKFPMIWGWATWRRAWHYYNFSMKDFDPKKNKLELTSFWIRAFLKVKKGEIDTWDYQWVYTIWKNKGKIINPKFSLIKNIGFNSNATHTQTQPTWFNEIQYGTIDKIIHPTDLNRNINIDKLINNTIYKNEAFYQLKELYVSLKANNRRIAWLIDSILRK